MGSEGIAGNLVVHLGGQAGGADGFGAGPGVNLALVDHLCARYWCSKEHTHFVGWVAPSGSKATAAAPEPRWSSVRTAVVVASTDALAHLPACIRDLAAGITPGCVVRVAFGGPHGSKTHHYIYCGVELMKSLRLRKPLYVLCF